MKGGEDMITRDIISSHKNNSFDIIEKNTLIERMRRVRALNAKPSNIGLTQYTWKTFAISKRTDHINKK